MVNNILRFIAPECVFLHLVTLKLPCHFSAHVHIFVQFTPNQLGILIPGNAECHLQTWQSPHALSSKSFMWVLTKLSCHLLYLNISFFAECLIQWLNHRTNDTKLIPEHCIYPGLCVCLPGLHFLFLNQMPTTGISPSTERNSLDSNPNLS